MAITPRCKNCKSYDKRSYFSPLECLVPEPEHICKNCKHWTRTGVFFSSKAGECSRFTINGANVLSQHIPENPSRTLPYLPEDFGCVKWEEKPQGPFFVAQVFNGITAYIDGDERGWGVIYRGSTRAIVTYPRKDRAEEACDRLNRLWAEHAKSPSPTLQVVWEKETDQLTHRISWRHWCDEADGYMFVPSGRYCPCCGARAPEEEK